MCQKHCNTFLRLLCNCQVTAAGTLITELLDTMISFTRKYNRGSEQIVMTDSEQIVMTGSEQIVMTKGSEQIIITGSEVIILHNFCVRLSFVFFDNEVIDVYMMSGVYELTSYEKKLCLMLSCQPRTNDVRGLIATN